MPERIHIVYTALLNVNVCRFDYALSWPSSFFAALISSRVLIHASFATICIATPPLAFERTTRGDVSICKNLYFAAASKSLTVKSERGYRDLITLAKFLLNTVRNSGFCASAAVFSSGFRYSGHGDLSLSRDSIDIDYHVQNAQPFAMFPCYNCSAHVPVIFIRMCELEFLAFICSPSLRMIRTSKLVTLVKNF